MQCVKWAQDRVYSVFSKYRTECAVCLVGTGQGVLCV